MNENDCEEKNLLNCLGNDHHNHHHRLLNNPFHSHSQHNYRTQYKQPQFEEQNYQRQRMNHHRRQHQHQLSCEQPWNKIDQVASVVSMSVEEDLLDNFELELFEGEQPDIVDSNTYDADTRSPDSTGNMSGKFPVAPVLSKLHRRITSNANQEDAKSKPLPANTPQSQQAKQQHRQQTKQRKSCSSRRNATANSDDEDNDKQASESRSRVEVPTTVDILCGQSRVCASHPGNRTFQSVLGDFAHKYDAATSKQEKMQMTKAVVTIIHDSGGRFLKHKNDMWEEISIIAARDKVSHALRTKVASWKRQRQQHQQDQQRHSLSPRSGRSSISRSSRSSRNHRRSGSNSPDNMNLISFDGNDVSSSGVVNGLIQAQQELFAQSMDSPETGDHNNSHHNNSHHDDNNTPLPLYHHQSQDPTQFRRNF